MLLKRRAGNITLMTVFMTSMIAFLLLLGDNVRALSDKSAAQMDATTEQAFYASQSCLEEAYLQLRENPDYAGAVELTVGTGTCSVTVTPAYHHATRGEILSTGSDENTIRTVTSAYTDAGPSTTRNTTKIFHVLDRSGSMKQDSCSDTRWRDQDNCERHHKVWGPRLEPMATAQDAAKAFNTAFMDSGYDNVGLISFAGDVRRNGHDEGDAVVDQTPTSDRGVINGAIDHMPAPDGATNIGWALGLADEQLPAHGSDTRVIILLTDGKPNSWCEADCTKEYARVAKEDHHILIFTIGLGTSLDEDLLKSVASENPITHQPRYYHAPTAGDLAAIYADIAASITTFNIGQGSWHER